jgi:hypothetical protein
MRVPRAYCSLSHPSSPREPSDPSFSVRSNFLQVEIILSNILLGTYRFYSVSMSSPSGLPIFPSDNVAFLCMVSLNVMFVTQALATWRGLGFADVNIALTRISRYRKSALFLPLIPNACALGTAFMQTLGVSVQHFCRILL